MNTMTKQLGLAASLVLASNFASANTYDIDAFGTEHGNSVTFDATFGTGVAGAFTDTFSFDTASFSNLDPFGAFNFSVNFQSTTAEMQEFTSLTLTDITGKVWNHDVFAFAQIDSTDAINYHSLAPGAYTMSLSGIALDTHAEYDMTAVLSPVPEPSAIALMLGGLGLVGFMAARRRKNA